MSVRPACKFRVTYGPHVARFSARGHAFEFARHIARMSGHNSEVRDATGLIGQFDATTGEATPEFSGCC